MLYLSNTVICEDKCLSSQNKIMKWIYAIFYLERRKVVSHNSMLNIKVYWFILLILRKEDTIKRIKFSLYHIQWMMILLFSHVNFAVTGFISMFLIHWFSQMIVLWNGCTKTKNFCFLCKQLKRLENTAFVNGRQKRKKVEKWVIEFVHHKLINW